MSLSRGKQLTLGLVGLTLAACGSDEPYASQDAAESGADVAVHDGVLKLGLANGKYTLHPASSTDWCVQVAGNVNRNGSKVVLGKCDNSASQHWTVKGSQWVIFGNKCLNVVDGADKNGTKLQIWTCSDNDANSRFSESNGKISWVGHQRVLDLADGKHTEGAALQLWQPYNNNTHQAFSAKIVGSSTSSSSSTTTSSPTKSSTTSSTSSPANSTSQKTHAPDGLDVAPYFVTWAASGSYLIKTPLDALNKAGADSLTIAFGIASSGGGCNLSNDLTSINGQIKAFADRNKRVILSFGGADGTYIQQSCSNPTSIANTLATQLKAIGQHNLDFDIENASLKDRAINGRLIDALVILQQRYNDLYVSYTLPVDAHSGLSSQSLQLLKDTKAKNVIVSRVNIMTMDFGSGEGTTEMGTLTLEAAEKTISQLKAIYTDHSTAELYHLLGITPMLGENDDHLKFTTGDAKRVADYAKQKGVGMLSFWNIQRDRAATGNLDDHSNVAESDYQFLHTFQAAR